MQDKLQLLYQNIFDRYKQRQNLFITIKTSGMLHYNSLQAHLFEKEQLLQISQTDIPTRKVHNMQKSSQALLDQYMSKMNASIPSRQKLIEILRANQIDFFQLKDDRIMGKTILKSNKQSSIIKIHVGNLTGNLSLIRVKQNSQYFGPKPQERGNFATISYLDYKKQSYVIKRINITKNNNLPEEIFQIFIAKIASALGVGPNFIQLYGYDAILFDDCIQFTMEKCETDFTKTEIKKEKSDKNLIKAVQILHSFNICHNDIKYHNIGWSNKSKRFVLLDYGFSAYNSVPFGYKSLTGHKGTYGYAYPEMKQLFIDRSVKYIDLYYNDFHCLQKTISELQSKLLELQNKLYQFPILSDTFDLQSSEESLYFNSQQTQAVAIQMNDFYYSSFVNFFLLKYFLFLSNMSKIRNIVNKQDKLMYSFKRVLNFSVLKQKNLKISHELIQIYQQFINSSFMKKIMSKKYESDQFLQKYCLKSEIMFQQSVFDRRLSQKLVKQYQYQRQNPVLNTHVLRSKSLSQKYQNGQENEYKSIRKQDRREIENEQNC